MKSKRLFKKYALILFIALTLVLSHYNYIMAQPNVTAPGQSRDILILRNGDLKEGVLQGCTAQNCTLGGVAMPRESIIFIGLHVVGVNLPNVRDYNKDEVHFTDNSVESGRVVRIDASNVVTDRRTSPRARVAWIYLADYLLAQQGRPSATPPSDKGTTPPSDKTSSKTSYVWEGRIEVENRFEGRTIREDVHGRHRWQGIYQVKFLEQWTDTSVSDLAGRQLYLNKFVPLEMRYTIQADHHHEYDHRWGDVRMLGQAVGSLTGDKVKDKLLGDIVRLGGPVASPDQAPSSFASSKEFEQFVFNTIRPGCYWVSIGFIHGNGMTARERRELYRGINRTGSSPIHPDPDQDFLRVMPAFMPDGTNIRGCLDSPGQAEARGGYSFPQGDPFPWPERPQITIQWSFARKRQ